MSIPKSVRIVEVGPRDGLQNEAQNVPTAVKIELIDRLTDAGLPVIEATAFVSPKWVPQMADAAAVMAGIRRKPGVGYPVLVPNRKGLDAAIAAGCDEVVVFGAATESFSKRNTNCSIAEGLARFSEVCAEAIARGLRVRGDISVCLGCPYEGEVQPAQVTRVARELFAMGCYEITIADTIGAGTPGKTQELIEACARRIPVTRKNSPDIFTTPTARRSPTRWPRSNAAWRPSTARWRGSAAAPTPRVPPAMSPAKTCSICSTAWVSPLASTCRS
jgi:hydroxymethylglutaryl-CoA lyase